MERLHGEATIGKVQRSAETIEKTEEIKPKKKGPMKRKVYLRKKRASMPERTTENLIFYYCKELPLSLHTNNAFEVSV